MKIRELISQLAEFNPEQEVCLYENEFQFYYPVSEVSAIFEPVTKTLPNDNLDPIFAVYIS